MTTEVVTRLFWQTQVRVLEEGYGDTDSAKDWLHDDSEQVFLYETKEDALAMLPEAMREECEFRDEQSAEFREGKSVNTEKWSWEKSQQPNDYGGNGFWFVLRCTAVEPGGSEFQAEGRALVRPVRVPVVFEAVVRTPMTIKEAVHAAYEDWQSDGLAHNKETLREYAEQLVEEAISDEEE